MKEEQPIKYLRELSDYFEAYGQALIEEIYIGVGIALGLSEKQAYEMAKKKPGELKKAGFFSDIFNRMKSVFKKKPQKFRYKKKIFGDGTPMTPEQWDIFNRHIDDYWQKEANRITGDVTAKSFMLGRETTKFKQKKKPYQNKSLYQVVTDQFGGKMPESIEEAYKNYDFDNYEKKAINKSLSNTAMYVTQASNDLKESIRQVVNQGIEDGKTPTEIASDLYWEVEKDPDSMNKYTAESLKKNWNRIAHTEMVSNHEAGTLAILEGLAMESMEDPSKAVYMARQGGTCEWCRSVRGTIVRLIPAAVASGIDGESLSSIGITDPNTDIAVWPGKNNVGRKQKDWLIACPGHPFNVATFTPIDLKEEFYNPKTDEVEARQKKQKFVPQMQEVERPKDFRKPKKIGGGLVQVGNNVYEAVSPDEFNKKLDEWRKDRSKPIPVNTSGTDYIRIFEAAE